MLDKSFSLVLRCTSPTIISALLFNVCHFDNYPLPCYDISTHSSFSVFLAVQVMLYSFSMSFRTTILCNALKIDIDTSGNVDCGMN